jgi:hypothetical protein
MSKFKAGDVVLIRGGKHTPEHYEPCIGQTGVLTAHTDTEDGYYDDDFVWHNEHWVVVDLTKPILHGGTLWSDLDFFEHELELLDENY